MAYYVVSAPDDTVTAISIFKDYAGAEKSNKRRSAINHHIVGLGCPTQHC